MSLKKINNDLSRLKDKKRATILQRFFKTGPGEYGEGDLFYGIRMPEIRKLAKKYSDISIQDIGKLMTSPVHEARLLAILLLVTKYQQGDDKLKREIYILYLNNSRFVNSWDLVDLSAHHIVGDYLFDKNRKTLYDLSGSKSLWERRIAMIATFYFIRRNQFDDTLNISDLLIADPEDLIHKAVGWMIREVGKRDVRTAERFLKPRYQNMPRTMLRYAIEKFPQAKRQRYLKGKI
jgi:3-methyladenine DNA glycosylase AlkD